MADPLETSSRTVDGVRIDVVRGGRGRPLLFLHSVDGIRPDSPFLTGLAESFEVVAPWHPGFGHSELPDEFTSVADLAYFHLQLADELGLQDAVLVGTSFGGWIAAEICVRTTAPFGALVLLDPVGIKVGDRETRDIADVFAISQEEMSALAYHDPAKRTRDYSAMTDEERLAIARSREAYTYFGWKPYMHNPGLKRWLRRIDIPTVVAWGASDRIVTPDYGRAFAAEIPGARFVEIPEAGHYPHIEQPAAVAELITSFAAAAEPAALAR
ncbi:alpha/beta fold hydrolase [Pseudonocardia thermophila]|jgi:Predicted hydrolases or acyltransferases (alpha/beta hydrolase superfamily)|uniref:alpha/beta fold hydrolase n=1 Tax=Pseudonocardia thermophila TaxID=1848 RepID=UPI00248ECCAF|nr:alpha/beta hydrolase [Pseudonocardia thermophila]